jgi:hypothetical protein
MQQDLWGKAQGPEEEWVLVVQGRVMDRAGSGEPDADRGRLRPGAKDADAV